MTHQAMGTLAVSTPSREGQNRQCFKITFNSEAEEEGQLEVYVGSKKPLWKLVFKLGDLRMLNKARRERQRLQGRAKHQRGRRDCQPHFRDG